MGRIRMQYLQPNGRYRLGSAVTETQWANFLVNHHDKQAHSLSDLPVYGDEKPIRFTTWAEFVSASAPKYPYSQGRLVAVCEDSGIWPISMEMVPDMEDRQMQFKEFFDDGAQSAESNAIRDSQDGPFAGAWAMASLAVFVIAAMIIVIITLQSKFAEDIGSVIPLSSIGGIW